MVNTMFDLELARVAMVLLLGLIGWFIAARVNLPAPAVLGSMPLIAIATMVGVPSPDFPHWARVLVQSIIGGYIGLKINRATIASLRTLLIPITISTGWFIAATLAIGYAMARLTTIDLYSALLAATPGGVAEVTAIAMSVHADVALVATMQAFRLVASNVMVPFLARHEANQRADARNGTNRDATSSELTRGWHWMVCVLIGTLGGFTLDALQVPAGGVIGAMMAVALAQLAGIQMQALPPRGRGLAQMFIGVFVGITFNQQTLIELQNSFVIIVAATITTLISGFLLAELIRRWMHLDKKTALLACAPGGLSLMPMIADELGAQTFVVSLFQLARIVIVIFVMPILFRFLI